MREEPPVHDLSYDVLSVGHSCIWNLPHYQWQTSLVGSTYSALELGPSHCLTSLTLGRIVNQNAVLENVGLSLAEEPNTEEGEWATGRIGKYGNEVESGNKGIDALDLEGEDS